MKYEQAKFTTFVATPIVFGFLAAILSLINDKYFYSPLFLFTIFLGIFCGVIAAILIWGVLRIHIPTKMLDRSGMGRQKLTYLYVNARNIRLNKDMDIVQLGDNVLKVLRNGGYESKSQSDEVVIYTTAIILAMFINQWTGKPVNVDEEILRLIKIYNDEIKVITNVIM